MKTLFYTALACLAFSFNACNVDQWTHFTLFYAGNSTFDKDTVVGIWNEIQTNKFGVDFADDLDHHGAREKQVEETWLDRCELHVIEPVTEDFKFLDSVEIYLHASGLAPLLIAKDENLNMKSDAKKIFLPLATDKDIEEYLQQDSLHYRIRYTQSEATKIVRHIKVNLKVKVDARKFGI